MINVRIDPGSNAMATPAVQDAVAAAERELGEDGRVLLRPSGTEPVIRVMVEGREAEQVERLCRSIAAQVEGALNAA
jgi:phosphoglucosamine mutase